MLYVAGAAAKAITQAVLKDLLSGCNFFMNGLAAQAVFNDVCKSITKKVASELRLA